MGRIRRALCWLLALACMACPSALAAGSGTAMKVTTAVECEDYNLVGSEWIVILFVDGAKVAVYANEALLESTASVSLSAGEAVKVSAFVLEADSEFPDYSEGFAAHTVTGAELEKGFEIPLSVTVRENAGQYKGNRAVWRVSFTFD